MKLPFQKRHILFEYAHSLYNLKQPRRQCRRSAVEQFFVILQDFAPRTLGHLHEIIMKIVQCRTKPRLN